MKKLGIAAAILASFVMMAGAHADHHEGKGKAKAHKAKAHKGAKAHTKKAKGKKAEKAAPKTESIESHEDLGGEMPPVTEEGDSGMGE
ncbi:MAG: hypothetical protein KF767_07550 [Bdellovibrionaceae bacterium]|nr:hypothetical protein [Pseudobdellovibrionaceae bacterium]